MKQNNPPPKTPIQKESPLLSPYAYPPDRVAEERAQQLCLHEELLLAGNSPKEAADKLRIALRTIYRWQTRSLREMVTAFKATNADGSPNLDKTAREALAVNILHRWAGAEGAVGHDYYWRWSSSNTQNDLYHRSKFFKVLKI